MHHLPNRQVVKESVKTVAVTPLLFLFNRAQSYRTLAADQANWKLGIARPHVKSIFRDLSTSRQIRRQPSCNIWDDRHSFKDPTYRIETGISFALTTQGAARPNPKKRFFHFGTESKMAMFVVTRSSLSTGRNVERPCGRKFVEAVLTIPPEQQESFQNTESDPR